MRTSILALLLPLVLAAPVLAQDRAPQSGAERAAQAYGAREWPASEASVAGVDPATVAATGFRASALRVDARHGQAQLSFALEAEGEAAAVAARVTIGVHKDGKAARAALLARLATTQVQLGREEALGSVAFGGRRDGRLDYALGAIGNVSYVVRGVGATDVEVLAQAVARAISRAPALKGAALAPRILACEAESVVVGQPAQLRLDFDPSAAPGVHLAFVCSDGAGVMKTKSGYELYTSKAGPVTLQIFACSSELRTSVFTVKLVATR
jgi:hypothetical protein